MKPEFATLHWYGTEQICSRHKSAAAALKAARACEKNGGSDHRIVEIVTVIPYGERKRK